MNARSNLSGCLGTWTGTNHLWLTPNDPVRESAIAATVALAAGDGFITIRYNWADEGKPQDGLLIVRNAPQPGEVDMVWIDSWHTGGNFMQFRGEPDPHGRISALGSYSAPNGPDWGWRIILAADAPDSLHLLMYNITPDGQQALAVDAPMTRAATP